MTRTLCTVVTLRFWADYPDDDHGADAALDDYDSALTQTVEKIPGVAAGSVSVDEADTTDD